MKLPIASLPIRPTVATSMPSLARFTDGAAAVPATVNLIFSRNASCWPGGTLVKGQPSASAMWAPKETTWGMVIPFTGDRRCGAENGTPQSTGLVAPGRGCASCITGLLRPLRSDQFGTYRWYQLLHHSWATWRSEYVSHGSLRSLGVLAHDVGDACVEA